jgi:hypothetical protein
VHIKEHVKLHIISGGWLFFTRSDQVGAGLCEFFHRNFEICWHRMTMDPGTDQLWQWRFSYIKEHVKLHILSGGWLFFMRSDQVDAGLCEFSHRNFEISGHRMTHGSRYRPAMAMGVLAYRRGRQTTYTIRAQGLWDVILASWCRGL